MARFSPTCFVAPALLFCGMFFISGCGLWQDAPEEKGMKVTAAVRGVHYCSRLSPELSIANPPNSSVLMTGSSMAAARGRLTALTEMEWIPFPKAL